ncbi:SDR family NAD(P)-dependent oxidoreductase [Pseudanabaena sp. FACHB-2040]|uniref:SDR family NAD(P)-dependent oxidoreductase n=1 Tax=Pseudanabaena sp. FACHB-2040 TaxID=2692859 RepID=UPI0016877B9A|nr:SDR family NAD(P)-dependent oxidoreductase [Pseudanabaena sp. FACHB-2040]MBD2258317.1 SDR family NAD(P)-dependent oxidoreductase [Pseudanabaena sp. FACHB-2040]
MNSSTRPLAVVTGASSGIGYELAKQFAENGFDLLITATGPSINEAAQTLQELGANVKTVQSDLSTYEGVEILYQEIVSASRPVDAIAINAGVGVGGEFARETDLRDELNLLNLNVVSTVHLAKRVVKDMVNRGEGRILFTSSIASIMPGPFEAVYAASKAFTHSFAEALRNELKDTGVTVTSLMPGPTDTNFFDRADMNDTLADSVIQDDPTEVAKQGFEALMSGKDSIIAGSFMTKLQGNVAKVLPDTVKTALHRQIAEPRSGK